MRKGLHQCLRLLEQVFVGRTKEEAIHEARGRYFSCIKGIDVDGVMMGLKGTLAFQRNAQFEVLKVTLRTCLSGDLLQKDSKAVIPHLAGPCRDVTCPRSSCMCDVSICFSLALHAAAHKLQEERGKRGHQRS